jgi:hypothetical protein
VDASIVAQNTPCDRAKIHQKFGARSPVAAISRWQADRYLDAAGRVELLVPRQAQTSVTAIPRTAEGA